MFVLFLIFAIIGIIVGGLAFFLGVAILSADIKREEDKKAEKGEAEIEEDPDKVVELTNEDLDNAQNIQKRIFSPLPYLLAAEGVISFIGSVVTLSLRIFSKLNMKWWIFAVCLVGFFLLSFFIDCVVMGSYAQKVKDIPEDNETPSNTAK